MSDFEIRTDTDSLAQKRSERRQSKTTSLIITAAAAASLLFVVLILVSLLDSGEPQQPPPPPPAKDPVADVGRSNVEPLETSTESDGPVLIADDGRSMWVSPTDGPPISLAGLPLGCELFVAIRPSELVLSGEFDKLLVASGPRGKASLDYIEQKTELSWAEIEELVIGVRPVGTFQSELTLVVTSTEGATRRSSTRHYDLAGTDRTFVVASDAALEDIKDLAGTPPPLRREMESLVSTSDAHRQLTVIAAPSFLFGDGRSMWQGTLAALRDPLFELLPDSTRCVAVSVDISEQFFVEVRLAATIDQRSSEFAATFAGKVAAWPATAEQVIASMTASSYSAAVVARLPAMLRVLTRYQRVGFDDEQALLRIYLPKPAGHNLLMASELLLAEQLAGGGGSATVTVASQQPQSLEERLAKRTSLSFARDTLEKALQLLGDEIGVEIVLLGGDLQLDGITKNQSFGLDKENEPAEEILVSILRLANPDKTASGPDDLKQKLVYVLGTSPSSSEPAILVTTRAAAEKRGETLPEVFQAN